MAETPDAYQEYLERRRLNPPADLPQKEKILVELDRDSADAICALIENHAQQYGKVSRDRLGRAYSRLVAELGPALQTIKGRT